MADPASSALPPSESDLIDLPAQFVDGINLRSARVQNYVSYAVPTYIDDNMEDERLCKGIHLDFEKFNEEHVNTSART